MSVALSGIRNPLQSACSMSPYPFRAKKFHTPHVFLLSDTQRFFRTMSPALRQSHHPLNYIVAIDDIYDNDATLSRTGSYVGLGWTAEPPAAVHRPEFLGLHRARRPAFFPSHIHPPYCRRLSRRQTPSRAGEACMV